MIRKKKRRGFTLLEILVVLGIIALITGVVAIGVIKHLQTARIETTRESAIKIRGAALSYEMARTTNDCPTVEALVKDELIDSASPVRDAWEQPFVIACDEKGGIRVTSSGPDKKSPSPDDIIVPAP